MAENIVLVPGSKVRQDGNSYKVVESSVVTGELIPYTPQKNRHAAMTCPSVACQKDQMIHAPRAGRIILRGSVGNFKEWPLPSCGRCGVQMTWIEEKDKDADTPTDVE